MNFKFLDPNDYDDVIKFAMDSAQLNEIANDADLISEFTTAAKVRFKEKKNKTYSLDVEVFSAGKWNGLDFSQSDIKSIANNFHKLKPFHRVPLKFGHNDEQPFTDGQPALGWVSDVFVKPGKDGKDKLFARFEEMPKIVFDAINAGLYKYVSIELDFDVQHKGINYDMVLSGVALLGADLPAVNNIADLKTYMSKDVDALEIAIKRRKVFKFNEDSEMAIEQLEAMQKEIDELKAQKLKLEAEKMQFERAEKDRLEKEKKAVIEKKRGDITAVFKKAIEEMKLTPAKVEVFSKMLGVNDDEKVLSIDVADIEKIISEEKPAMDKSESASFSKTGDSSPAKKEGETAGEFIHNETIKFSIQNKIPYREALNQVYRLHPEEARKHINAQG